MRMDIPTYVEYGYSNVQSNMHTPKVTMNIILKSIKIPMLCILMESIVRSHNDGSKK